MEMVRLVLCSLCGVRRFSAEAPLQAQTPDMWLWQTCKQQKSWCFFFFFIFSPGLLTYLISLVERIPHITQPLLPSRRRRQPSFTAGRFYMKPTSTWETTRICAFVGSFTLRQIRRRCVLLMFPALLPSPSHSLCTSVLFASTQLCVRERKRERDKVQHSCVNGSRGNPTEFGRSGSFSIILLALVLLMHFVVRQIQSHNVAPLWGIQAWKCK